MPLIDENTKHGFIALGVIHLIFLVLTIIATACTDFMFVMLVVNIPVLSTIFSDHVRELNDMLREENVNESVARAKLKNILLMHQEIWE